MVDKWPLGYVYDITEYFNTAAQSGLMSGVLDSSGNCIYEKGYFICRDVKVIWIFRIQVGINAEYEKEPRTKIIETYRIPIEEFAEFFIEKQNLQHDIYFRTDYRLVLDLFMSVASIETIAKRIVEMDYHRGFENDTVEEFRYDRPLDQLYSRINGGFGIEKLVI